MKKYLVFLIFIPCLMFPQRMKQNAEFSLFSDYKAARVGDAITIIVVESSQAANKAETATGRKSNIGFGGSAKVGDAPLPDADFNLGTTNNFKGSGSTKSSGMVRTKISAIIDSVMPNGLLSIKGSRKIVINGEEQNISIKGVVRGSDIRSDNTVYSYNISDAEIIFDGSGAISRAQSPGWLTKLFHWLF
ncbi:flagellar L-ring protein precursor [bacterium BMS3Abin04]|nr:flagellar L-ring protein precursor [bacterium BMS3Abin04]